MMNGFRANIKNKTRIHMNREGEELQDLQDYLTNNFPNSFIMPIRSQKDKSPKYPHKNNQWSEEKAKKGR